MIEVVIRHKESEAELGVITIEKIGTDGEGDEFGSYSIRFGVEKIRSVGIHRRGISGFPRTKYNVLALLLQALNTLEPRDLELDGDYTERRYRDRNFFLRRLR